MDAVNTYKELYYNKYHPGNDTLTLVMMNASFINFKCDFTMDEDDMIDDHVRDVHDVDGIESMKPVQRIEVDTKLEMSSPKRITKALLIS